VREFQKTGLATSSLLQQLQEKQSSKDLTAINFVAPGQTLLLYQNCSGSGFTESGSRISSESGSGSESGTRVLMTKNWEKIELNLFYIFF
jgi:hypothetical protein